MTEDVSAGRLHIDAYADTTGVTRGMQRRLDAEMARAKIRAKVKVAIDTRGVVGEARKAAAEASKAVQANVRIKVRMAVDRAGLVEEVRAAAKEASAAAQIKAKVALDQASAAAATAQVAAVSRDRTATIETNADTTAAAAQIEAMRQLAGRDVAVDVELAGGADVLADAARLRGQVNALLGEVEVKVKADSSSLTSAGRALSSLSKIPMLAGGFYTLGSAIVTVGGGLVAMASSAASAAGALAAIPNLIGIAGQGLGVLIAGFSGVGDAVSAMGAAETSAATDAGAAADARAAAADRVRSAQQSLGNAMQAAGNQARQSAEAVSDAQWSLARAAEGVTAAREGLSDAHYNAAQAAEAAAERITQAEENAAVAHRNVAVAQRDLTRAREDARERIEDMNEALRLSRLDEEAGMAALVRAREDLQDVEWNAAASPQERRDAEMAVKEAERQLERIRSGNEELAEDVAEANRKGVKGSDEVRNAQANLTAAQQDQKDAVEEISEARQDARRVAIESARSIRDAEYGVRDALHAQQEAREGLTEAQIAQAQGAQDSAQAVANAQRELRAAQKAATDVANEQSTAQIALTEAMDNLSPAGQRFARFLSNVLLPRLKEMRFAIQEAILPGIQKGITAAMPLLDTFEKGLVGTARIIGRFAGRLGKLFGRETFNNDVAAIMKSNNRALRDFLPAIRNLIVFFKDLAVVAGPSLVEPFAEWVRMLTRGWKQSIKTEEGQKRLADWFDKVRARVVMLKNILGNLGRALFGIGKAANPTGDSLLGTFEKVTKRWAEWANSDLGQERMRKFFEAVEPVTKAFGRLISSVTELFVKLGEGGASPLTTFLNALTKITDGIIWLLDTIPGLSKVIGWFMLLAGVGGAFGFVSGQIMKMVGRIGKLAPVFRLLGKVLAPIGRALMWLGGKVLPLIIRLAPLIGRAVSLMFGPWGLAIMAVVGLFVLLYNRVGWFRDAVQWVMEKVVDAFNWVVDGAKHLWDVLFGHSVFPDIMDGLDVFRGIVKWVIKAVIGYFKLVAKVAKWLYSNVFKPVFKAIAKAISWAWDKVLKPTFKAVWAGLKEVGKWATWLWKNAIKPAWEAISKGIKAYWNNVLKPVFKFLWSGLKEIGKWAKWLWENAIKPAWDKISDAIDFAWNKIIEPAFAALSKFIKTTLPDAFRDGVDAIRGFWNDLRDIAMRPIKFIVETLWNNGLRKMINAIPGMSDMDPISTESWASGTANVLPGYTPGRDVHSFVSPTGGRLNLSGGEAIMRPEWTRVLGTKAVDTMNAAAARGTTALRKALGSDGAGRMVSAGQRLRDKALGFATGGILNFASGGVNPMPGASMTNFHGTNYLGTGAWAGDYNGPGGGNTDANWPAVAWKAGRVLAALWNGEDGSYGNRVEIDHGSAWTRYAHLNKILVKAGQMVRQGQTIGLVGGTGNDGGNAHLHFEISGGTPPTSGGTFAGAGTSGSAAAEPKSVGGSLVSQWRNAIGTIKDVVGRIPDMVSNLRDNMGPWGSTIATGARTMGSNVIQWINDKIPNRFLPDNPIPNIFDRGGDWASGVLGLNMSGSTETVFTNSDMVELGTSLRATAFALRAMITDSGGAGGLSPLVGELTLMGRPEDMPNLLADANLELRRIRRGGVHAQRTAGAPA